MLRSINPLLNALFITLSVTVSCYGGPTVKVGQNIPAGNRVSMDQIDHSTWDALLRKYVDADGLVNYRSWKAEITDQQQLDSYINHLSSASLNQRASSAAKLAFWINAYNAVTIKGILREYPTSSIRNHTAKLYGYNIWKDLKLQVDGSAYSLDDIEHKLLRKMGEPRIHFAIVCASVGCPRLLNEAYTAEALNDQLTRNAKVFFQLKRNFSVDSSSRTVYLSSILDWFGADFGANTQAQLKAIAPYAPQSSRQLLESGSVRVKYLSYDWALNDQG